MSPRYCMRACVTSDEGVTLNALCRPTSSARSVALPCVVGEWQDGAALGDSKAGWRFWGLRTHITASCVVFLDSCVRACVYVCVRESAARLSKCDGV